MKKITLKSGMNRLYLMSFILLCSVFTSENAFSGVNWEKKFLKIDYDKKNKNITFDLVFNDNTYGNIDFSYIPLCLIEYSEDGVNFYPIIKVSSEKQKNDQLSDLKLTKREAGQILRLINTVNPKTGATLPDNKEISVKVKVADNKGTEGAYWEDSKRSHIMVNWVMTPKSKPIKSIRVLGHWKDMGDKKTTEIKHVYLMDNLKQISKKIENTPSELEPEISDKVKVSAETEAINVTGAEAGEHIKVFNASGVEIKSAVATDDVVNIKLQKNQTYNVKVGKKSYKVTL